MKETTKIKIEQLKDAVYMIVAIETDHGHVWNETIRHTFTDMLSIIEDDYEKIDEAVDYLDVPVGFEYTITDEFQVDETEEQREAMLLIRIK